MKLISHDPVPSDDEFQELFLSWARTDGCGPSIQRAPSLEYVKMYFDHQNAMVPS